MKPLPQWLSYSDAAAILKCSRQHISTLARAAESRGRHCDAITADVRDYMDEGFPIPCRFGRKLVRIDAVQFQQWMERRACLATANLISSGRSSKKKQSRLKSRIAAMNVGE